MSARSQNPKTDTGEESSLISALRDCLASGVLVVDACGRIISYTPEAARLLRLGGSNTKSSTSPLPPALQKLIQEVVSHQTPVPSRTITLPNEGDDATALQASAIPVKTPDSTQVVLVFHDISLAKRLEENMRRLDRLASIGTLSASMSHEIKNALVAVKTFVELLLEKNLDSELTQVVRREMRRIDSIVGQMLKFAAPARPSFSAVHLHPLLDHSLRMVQHQLEGKLISLSRSFRAAPDSIKGDDYQLEQAFVNLLLNAVEAMGESGALTVATDLVHPAPGRTAAKANHSQPQVRITIADTGSGITPENMDKMFEPFFTTKRHGTGLGLPIARRIVQEHHGDILVNSEPNKGTTFSILIPANVHAH